MFEIKSVNADLSIPKPVRKFATLLMRACDDFNGASAALER